MPSIAIPPPEPTINVEDAIAQKELVALAVAMGKDVSEVVEQQARLLVEELISVTPPFGSLGGREAIGRQRKIGEAAVDRDLTHLFSPLEDLDMYRSEGRVGKRLRLLVRRGDFAALSSMMQYLRVGSPSMAEILPSSLADVHRAARDNRGHVRQNPRRNWVRRTDFARYKKSKKSRVLTLKAGWGAAARSLGAKFPAMLAKREIPGTGDVVNKTSDKTDPYVLMTNRANYATDAIERTTIRYALRNRQTKMRRQLDNALRIQARRSSGRMGGAI